MKILFATEYYPPFAPGGSPWSIRLLAEELARRGHAVTVVTPNYGAAPREDLDGVSVVRFPFWRRVASGAALLPTRDLVSPRFHYRLFRAMVDEARRSGAEVIHAQDKHALVGSFFAARALRRPVFLTLRDTGLICPITTCLLVHDFVPADCSAWKLQRECAGFFLDHYIRGGWARRARVRLSLALLYFDACLKGLLLQRLDGLVSVSRGLLEIYLRAGRGRRETGRVVYTLPPHDLPADPAVARDTRARYGLEGRKVVLYVGKLSLGKGGPVFLHAAQRVAATRSDSTFLVVGPDCPDQALPSLDLRWLGRLEHGDLLALYAAVDVVVVPSVGPEALPRILLEAAAAGRPTIGTRTGGIPEEVVHEQTGILVERNDVDALREAMLRLLADDELRGRLGQNARRFVAQHFGPDAVVQSLLDVYAAARR